MQTFNEFAQYLTALIIAVIGYFLKDFHKQNKNLKDNCVGLSGEISKTNQRVELLELRMRNDIEVIQKDIHQLNESMKKFDSTMLNSTSVMRDILKKLNEK